MAQDIFDKALNNLGRLGRRRNCLILIITILFQDFRANLVRTWSLWAKEC